MRKFPEIKQYRHVVETVTHRATYVGQGLDNLPLYDASLPKPTLTFTGTVKLHGTNSAAVIDLKTNVMSAQSRERELTLDDDNHGFAAWVESASAQVSLAKVRVAVERIWTGPVAQSIHVFGEWAGRGINGKTGVGKLDDRFYVFAILVTDETGTETWLEPLKVLIEFYVDGAPRPADFCFMDEFTQWQITIDFNDPEAVLDDLEALTLEVERSCPVAVALGGEGIGEGIVWIHTSPKFGRLVFKTKGEKHKGTKSNRLVGIAPEVLASREAFVDAVLTESRLEQAFEVIQSQYGKVSIDVIGEFLKWVGMDVLKEESDTLKASGLDRKDVMSSINRRAKTWVAPRLATV